MVRNYDTVVIGGGASGQAAALAAAENGEKTLILEAGKKPGRKILASGNGRCNLLNTGPRRYFGDCDFANQVLDNIGNDDIFNFFDKCGILLREENEGRVYPYSGKASTVENMLQVNLALRGTEILNETKAVRITLKNNGNGFIVGTVTEAEIQCKRVIVATGGMVQPKLGGNTSGYELLSSMGHHITEIHDSLVPLTTEKKPIYGLSGIRVRCTVSVFRENNKIHTEQGEILFTDYGISGICVMQCSRYVTGNGEHIEINMIPESQTNNSELMSELKRRRKQFQDFPPETILFGILEKSLSRAVMRQAGILQRVIKAGDLRNDDLSEIIKAITAFRIKVTGKKGINFAQVTAGGARCDEFRSDTLESIFVPGLHACGEVLNVDGDCGGFNLMFAFASGILAGRNKRTKQKGGYNHAERRSAKE